MFVRVHVYQRDDCPARKYFTGRWKRCANESTLEYTPAAEEEELQYTWLIYYKEMSKG